LTEPLRAPEITDNLSCADGRLSLSTALEPVARPATPRHPTERHPMRWPRNWLGRKAPAASPRLPSFRPCLERLEDRRVMNVSSAFDAQGNVLRLVVDNNNTLTQTYQGVTTVLAQDVFRAHAYRDITGTIGFTVVYGPDSGFAAFDYYPVNLR
jgi:hypothetical protein